MDWLKNNCKISGFLLKVIAVVCMTIDHVGYCLDLFDVGGGNLSTLIYIFRLIGRFAMPLFCFLAVEGALHTHNTGLYIAKLGVVGAIVLAGQLICEYVIGTPFAMGNIFIDLILGVLFVYLIRQKNKKLRWLAALPIAYAILSFVVSTIEYSSAGTLGLTILWMPYFIRTQYGFYSILIMVGFYLAYRIADFYYKNNPVMEETITTKLNNEGEWVDVDDIREVPLEETRRGSEYRAVVNISAACIFIVITLLQWIVGWGVGAGDYLNSSFQNWALLASVLILFYSGKRGYDNKGLNHGFYAYYPVHLVILYACFILLV